MCANTIINLFIKITIMKMVQLMRGLPLPRMAIESQLKRGWIFILFLLALLPFSQMAMAYSTDKPSTYGWKVGTYPNDVHLQFEYVFYNYDVDGSSIGNAGYDGPITMTINGEDVKNSDGNKLNLKEVWGLITDQWKKDANLKQQNIPGMVGNVTYFTTASNSGKIVFSNLREGNNHWEAIHVDIILANYLHNNKTTVTLDGTWCNDGTQSASTLTLKFDPPSVTSLPSFSVLRQANGLTKLAANITKQT